MDIIKFSLMSNAKIADTCNLAFRAAIKDIFNIFGL